MRILLVEDDPDLSRQLKLALGDAGYAVDHAPDGEEAQFLGETEPYDAIILDLGLPKVDGVSVLERWRRENMATPVLILTARGAWSEKVAGFDAGADDYLTKPFDTEELLARVRTALRHRIAGEAGQTMVTAGEIEIDLERRRVRRDDEDVHLSPKEYDVLAELARRPDRVIGHRQLLRTVWGPAHEDHVDYLRIVVRNLRQKLEADPARPRLITNEPGVGYRLTGVR